MEVTKASVVRYSSPLILAAALVLLVSFLLSHKSFIRLTFASCKLCTQLKRWWERQQGGDSSSEVELDVMRCKWMQRFLFVCSVLTMCRLVSRQVAVLREDNTNAEFDLHILAAAVLSLVVTSFPRLITPKSLDVWYVLILVILDAVHLIPPVEVDVRDVMALGFPIRFILAVLAKRICCVAFCILVHLLQAILIARLQGQRGGADSTEWLVGVFSLMFFCILIVRNLMRENVLLKVDLQKRTVELGAVSSLLTACYDAVVELDQNFKLTQDSGQLSSMLLQTAPKVGGLAGKSLLDFFSEGDRERISEQVLNPVENISAVALNADMLDSDFNHVQVELFCAQFKNLASERCFLVGLRELQDLEPPAPLGPSDPSRLAGNEALLVMYDVYSFDIHIMNGEMQRLCRPYFGDTTPDSILSLASDNTRLSLRRQWQDLGNAIAVQQPNDIGPTTVTFDFLGFSGAEAVVSIEYDHLLDAWMGSMVFHLTDRSTNTLTESNLQNLPPPTQHGLHGLRALCRRSTSSRSSRSSSRSSRGSPSASSRSHHSAMGTISELHYLREACVTKLKL